MGQVVLLEVDVVLDAGFGRVCRGPIEGCGGYVYGCHPPTEAGQPDRIAPFAATEIQRRAGRWRPGDVDQHGVRLPAPHPFLLSVMLLPEPLGPAALAVKLTAHLRSSLLFLKRTPFEVAGVDAGKVVMAIAVGHYRPSPAGVDRRSRWAVTASRVSSATRSALMAAPATAPALAEPWTCALGSVMFPATQTPGTVVRPVASASMCPPMPEGWSVVSSPRPVSIP